MTQYPPIRVIGIPDFRRDLKAVDASLVKELGEANAKAAQVVIDDAIRRAHALGGVAAKTVDEAGLRSSKATNAVKAILGGARVPYALGAEFGAKRYRQFPPWRGNQWEPDRENGVGYFLHPAIRATRDEFLDTYGELLDELRRKAFNGKGPQAET